VEGGLPAKLNARELAGAAVDGVSALDLDAAHGVLSLSGNNACGLPCGLHLLEQDIGAWLGNKAHFGEPDVCGREARAES